MGAPVPPRNRKQYKAFIDSLREHLDGNDFSKAWNEGCKLTLDAAIEMALQRNDVV